MSRLHVRPLYAHRLSLERQKCESFNGWRLKRRSMLSIIKTRCSQLTWLGQLSWQNVALWNKIDLIIFYIYCFYSYNFYNETNWSLKISKMSHYANVWKLRHFNWLKVWIIIINFKFSTSKRVFPKWSKLHYYSM